MADEKTYLIRIAAWLGQAIGDTSSFFDDFSSDQLGLWLPDAVMQTPVVTSALKQAEVTAVKVRESAIELESVATSESEQEILAGFLKLGSALTEFFVAFSDLADGVEAQITPATVPDAAARADAQAFATVLAKKLGDWAIASAITERVPEVAYVLKLAGLLEWTYIPRGAGLTRGHIRRGLRLDRIKGLISDPVQHFQDSIGWGRADFDPTDFFRLAREFHNPEDAIEVGVKDGDPFIRGCIEVRRDSSVSPPGLRLVFFSDYTADVEEERAINDEWGIGLRSNLRMAGGITGSLTPPMTLTLQAIAGEITGQLCSFFERNEEKRPFEVIGGTGLMSLSANNTTAGLGLKAQWDIVDQAATVDPWLFAEIDGLTLSLGTSDADSFIGNLLAAAEIEGEFNLTLEWLASTGLRVQASGDVEIALPIHKELGPVELQTIYLALQIKDDGTLSLEMSAGLTGNLGPISATIERIGAQLDLLFVEDVSAKFGPFDIDLGFKPPNGVGLTIDAEVVRGGGYLYFDFDKEEYAGVLELDLSGIVSVKAIGLITTRMPDGSAGFSLLIIITAEFGSPIQLGFGFTLSGVGGLLGLNRTMRLEVIATGIRDGGINSLMFPQNVVENAPRIISDLKTYFPVEEGTFLIGPMVKIGWGTPNLITVSLGILIEIPGNIAILGVLKVALPDDEAAVIVIQVNFMGAIEFDKKRLWFLAALFESRVLFITLEGEMGLLVGWGDDASFVVSVGGFHPAFNPPPLPFGAIARIAISILNEDYARIRIEGYFAVTSNSVQFGAAVELFFGVSAFRIEGHLAFDALFRFSPFYFIISISTSLSVKVFGIGLFSVSFHGSLEGPTPWHVEGTGSISLLFFDIDVDFSHTWGNEVETTLDPISVLPLLVGEFQKPENWRAVLPDNNQLLVTLRSFEPGATDMVLHPVGSLQVSQRVVPLGITIDKVGNQKPSDANKFDVTVGTSVGIDRKSELQEPFAVGQFFAKSDNELLNAKSFEPMKSGLELSVAGEQYSAPEAVKRVVRYEKIIIDTNFQRLVVPLFAWFGSLFTLFLGGNAVSKSTLSHKHKKQLKPFEEKVVIGTPLYVVAFHEDNSAFSDEAMAFTSQVQAQDFMNEQIASDSNLANQLHVIPLAEMQKAL